MTITGWIFVIFVNGNPYTYQLGPFNDKTACIKAGQNILQNSHFLSSGVCYDMNSGEAMKVSEP